MTFSRSDWSKLRNASLLLLALSFLLYLPSIFYYSFADDEVYLAYSNHLLREGGWGDLYQLLLQPANPWEFLPIRDFTYWLDFRLHGDELSGFHATNLVLYFASCLSCFWMAREFLLFQSPRISPRLTACALCCTVLFAIHPAHVEVVVWIASRKDLLATTFGFCSVAMLLRSVARTCALGETAVALLLFVVACFSKATAIAYIVAIITILMASSVNSSSDRCRSAYVGAVFVVAVAVVAYIHMRTGEATGIRLTNHLEPFLLLERASRILAVLVGILMFPYPLHFYYDVYQIGDWHWIVSSLTLATFGWAVFFFTRTRALSAAGVILAISPLFVYLQLTPFTTWSLASERFVFPSVVGLSLIAVDIMFRHLAPQRIVLLICTMTMVAAVVVWARVAQWEDSRRMLASEYERQPGFHNAIRDQIAYTLLPAGKYLEALALAETVSRPYARDVLVSLVRTEQIYQNMRNNRSAEGKGDQSVKEFCLAVHDLRSALAAGRAAMVVESDVSYNNILRTVEQWLKYQYGDSGRVC